MLEPLPDFLERSDVNLIVLTEALLQYIREADALPNLVESDQVLIVEDCKRFFFILTGVWWTKAP